uniref:Uncharacterized protein n=1 Tax=Astyanax mexicanus TaxID=7994 RepID=A0A8B9JSX8_ASTMX
GGGQCVNGSGSNLYRLRDRKFLLEDKRRLCAWALGAAMLGILLMIGHAELCPAVYQPVGHPQHHTHAHARVQAGSNCPSVLLCIPHTFLQIRIFLNFTFLIFTFSS